MDSSRRTTPSDGVIRGPNGETAETAMSRSGNLGQVFARPIENQIVTERAIAMMLWVTQFGTTPAGQSEPSAVAGFWHKAVEQMADGTRLFEQG